MQKENKENTAVEKVEIITGERQNKTSKQTGGSNKAKNVKKDKDVEKQKRHAKKEAERKKSAKIKKLSKEEKEKQNKLKKEKKEEIRKLKLQKKAEKQERKDYIKQQNKAAKAERKAQKAQAKAELKAKKAEAKAERKKQRNGIGGWIAAVVSLGCAVVLLSVAVGTMYFMGSPINNDASLNGIYEERFYDLVGYVESMDVKLSKLMVSRDSGEQQKLLSELSVDSNLAVKDVTSLPLEDESRFYTTKFINQVGDFSTYLNNKIIDGGKVDEEDYQNINNMQEINARLKGRLTEVASMVSTDKKYNFKDLLDKKANDAIINVFDDMETSAVDYPQMIYDGPFSDGLKNREAKGLDGLEEISTEQAIENFKKYFNEYGIEEVSYVGDTVGKNFECYNLETTDKDGVYLYAQISKMGGKLMSFNYYKECTDKGYDAQECIKIAEEFLSSLGISDMAPVWYADDDDEVTVNFAFEKDDVIFYPDLIKVNVCKERGVVNGMEATEYYLNHTKRKSFDEQITEKQAREKVFDGLKTQTVRLCVIPVGEKEEKLAYEFSGEYADSIFYVYIDAVTGKELNIFKVVKTTEGTLLV